MNSKSLAAIKEVAKVDGEEITMVEDIDAELTPSEIVAELDKYIIGQNDAKRAVAIALRNRWRRLRVPEDIRDEIMPKNIIMIGPTGVGKTEISRRLARLVRAPFVKVEASKFTEVGYVGRDVESIVRDLADSAYHMVAEEQREAVLKQAEAVAEEEVLDLLLPGSRATEMDEIEREFGEEQDIELVDPDVDDPRVFFQDEEGIGHADPISAEERSSRIKTREKLRKRLQEGRLEERIVEIEITRPVSTHMQILGPQGFGGEVEGQFKDMLANMLPKQRESKRVPVSEARKILIQEAQDNLIDHDQVTSLAIERAEQTGIVFIDEIDKICGASAAQKGPDVSREGVQRDLLPLVEGSTVGTKYGTVRSDHVLFIASGAFHLSKPSDLMPEFQGRFPIRVELKSLTPEDFVRILTEPKNALTIQYVELLKTEGVQLEFADEAIKEIARLTAEVNSRTENIGARRLHTLLEKLLEDLSFDAHVHAGESVTVDKAFVNERLKEIVEDSDLSRYIL